MPDVTPRFKVERAPKEPKRLRRIGKKGRQDAKEMRAAMKVVRARSGGHCEMHMPHECTRIADHPHHRVRRSQGGSNDPQNIVHTCFSAHRWIHDNPAQARLAGYLA